MELILAILIKIVILAIVYFLVEWVLTQFVAVPVKILQLIRILFVLFAVLYTISALGVFSGGLNLKL